LAVRKRAVPPSGGKSGTRSGGSVGLAADGARILEFAQKRDWHVWLESQHVSSEAVWLLIAKHGDKPCMSYQEALEVALAWGWIDSQKQKHDDKAWRQRFSRRKARSPWSKINRDKATALIAAGEMQAPGLAEVERAQADGRWAAAYDSARTSTVPDDLVAALTAKPRAAAFFATLDATNRYAILYRVQTAKKPETRAKRIADFVAMLARHETVHPVRGARAKGPLR
jgi:uncharacterized protein YdeI (YjbR/CyaY-like superfamily)